MIEKTKSNEVVYDVIEIEGDAVPAKEWCHLTFGPAGKRWFFLNNRFYFKQSKDALLFELRW